MSEIYHVVTRNDRGQIEASYIITENMEKALYTNATTEKKSIIEVWNHGNMIGGYEDKKFTRTPFGDRESVPCKLDHKSKDNDLNVLKKSISVNNSTNHLQ